MADYGWRNDDRYRWDRERNRFESDPRGAGRSGWRNDAHFTGDRFGENWNRWDRDAGRNRARDFGRESDYGAGYATPFDDADPDLRNRPTGMRDDDRYAEAYGRYGRGTGRFDNRDRYASFYGSASRSDSFDMAGDDDLYGQGGGYGDDDRTYRPAYAGRSYDRAAYGQNSGNSGDGDRSWWDRASDEVASWAGDPQASRRRDIDRMRSHSGRGPKGYVRSDDRIREDVNDRLTEDWRLDATNIEVTVSNGEVTLAGTVDDRDDKHRAEHLVENLSGVRHVQNNLRVDESASQRGLANPALSTPVGSAGVGTSRQVVGTQSNGGGAASAGQSPSANSTH